MIRTTRTLIPAVVLGLLLCGTASADLLPGDTLSITLDPLDGAVHGLAGATAGWGFTVNWTSTNGHWISFTGSSIGSVAPGGNESNPSLLALYTDFIGFQGGPNNFATSPADSPWIQLFDGVSQGVGAYQISNSAVAGAQDTGQITFYYSVSDGDPLAGENGIFDGSYYGASTAFSVTVDTPGVAPVPEPGSVVLLLTVTAVVLFSLRRRALGRC